MRPRAREERGEGAGPGKRSLQSLGGAAGWAGWGTAREVTQGQRRTGPWKTESGERGEWVTLNGLAARGTEQGCRRSQNAGDVPRGRAQLLGPIALGFDIWTE